MDILPLLDELQTIARNGLYYARDPFDRERYQRLYELALQYYGQALDLPAAEARTRLGPALGYITPQVGADAAVFDEEGRILLVLRQDDRLWCLPCGWVEPNEAPVETAVREAFEETGLEVVPLELVDVFATPAGGEVGPHTVVAVIYLCEVRGGSLHVSHESLDVRYWHMEDVPGWHARHHDYAVAARSAWEARERRACQN